MNIKEKHICRLCLQVAKDEYQIDEIMKQIFGILLLNLDLDITKDPIICQDCLEVSKKCLNFKNTCISTEKFIVSYSADRKEVKYDIKVIYKEKTRIWTGFGDFNICRFCMIRLERKNFTSLDTSMNESMFDMLGIYMTEMDFTAIENPMVCTNCNEHLNGYFKFVVNCLNMEEKIQTYCKEKGSDNIGQIKLHNVLLFICTEYVLKHPDKCSQTYKIEQESTECVFPEAYIGLIKQEEVDVKDKEMILNENSYGDLSQIKVDKNGDTFSPKGCDEQIKFYTIHLNTREHNKEWYTYQKDVQTNIMEDSPIDKGVCEEVKSNQICNMGGNKCIKSTDEHVKNNLTNHSDVTEPDMYENTGKVTSELKQKCKITKPEKIRNDTSDLQRHISVEVNTCRMYKCSLCTYEGKQKHHLERHMLVHKDISEINMYKCSLCPYEAKQKHHLTTHMLLHKDISEIKMYKCSLCAYEAKQKSNLTSHMLVHKHVSEIQMYKCPLCTYEAKQKRYLITHMMVHKNVSEIKMFRCSLCTYEARQKGTFNRHMLIHKNASDIRMYKCSLCVYEGKTKGNLNKHMLVHKDILETETYKCSQCAYKAKQKSRLTTHIMLVHKDGQIYNCSFCTFKGKRKTDLNRHMLVHKDTSEIRMYQCSLCTYNAKQKGHLTTHMLVHKDVSEIQMYKCSFCAYEAKHKGSLKTHMLSHMDVSEIEMFKCSLCNYKAKQKSNITSHMLVHKDLSETQMYKCSSCTFESKHKRSLNTHMLKHKDVSEIKMYKCSLCTFESKLKGNLKTHMLVHKSHNLVSETELYKCLLCSFVTKHKNNLNTHALVHRIVSE